MTATISHVAKMKRAFASAVGVDFVPNEYSKKTYSETQLGFIEADHASCGLPFTTHCRF